MRAHRVRTSGDRGAVLIVVAVFSIVAVIFLALVVDVGGLRSERKEVTTSTDAAALAGVALIDFSVATVGADQSCDSVLTTESTSADPHTVADAVTDYLSANGGSTQVDCSVTIQSTRNERAFVTVAGEDTVDYAFDGATGRSEGTATGASSAAIDSDGGGLRPFGICEIVESLQVDPSTDLKYGFAADDGSDPLYESLVDDAANDAEGEGYLDGEGSGPPEVLFPIDKLDGTHPCGDAPGNFGQLDLADNSGSNAPGSCNNVDDDDKLCDNVINGYDGDVSTIIYGSTGNNYNPFDGPFTDLEDAETQFWVPVYETVTPIPSVGSEFVIEHWMEVLPLEHCFKVNACGIEASDGEKKRWFEWRVLRIVGASAYPDGPPLTGDALRFAPRICGLDDGDTTYC